MAAISFNMIMIVAFIAIQIMAFAMKDQTLIYVSITASVAFIVYVMMQFMSSDYSGSRTAAVDRLKATGTAIRDPNNRFNSAMGRTFGGMKGMVNSAIGPDSRLAGAAYSMGMGRPRQAKNDGWDESLGPANEAISLNQLLRENERLSLRQALAEQ